MSIPLSPLIWIAFKQFDDIEEIDYQRTKIDEDTQYNDKKNNDKQWATKHNKKKPQKI